MAQTPKKQDAYQKARRPFLITKELAKRFDDIRQILGIKQQKFIKKDTLAEQVLEEWVKAKEKEYEKILAVMHEADKQISSILEKTDEQSKGGS